MALTAPGSTQSDLFTVDLTDGSVRSLGHIGDAVTVRAIA
jgi:hypothetical protein